MEPNDTKLLDNMDELYAFVASEMKAGVDKPTIIEKLVKMGLENDIAAEIVEEVMNVLEGDQALKKAEKHIRNAWIVGIIYVALAFIFSVYGAYSEAVRFKYGFDTWTLLDVAIIGALIFGTYKKNRFCALSLLVYIVLVKITTAAHTGKITHGIGALLYGYFLFQGTIATFQIHKHLVETGQKSKKKRGTIYYMGVGISGLVIIAFGCLIILATFMPESEVIPGRMLNKKYSNFVREQRLIKDGEEILYWYSDALLDFKTGFYFFTKEKVIVYCKDWEDSAIIMPFGNIEDITFKSSDSFFEESQITLKLNDNTEVYFPVSREKGGDKKFYNTLTAMWKRRLKTTDKNYSVTHNGVEIADRPGRPFVYGVNGENKEMNDAITKARETVSDFTQSLQNPNEKQTDFSIKCKFSDGEYVEHIWLDNVTFDGSRFHGEIANEPLNLTNISLGDQVAVLPTEISDWMIIEDNRLVGGYTIRVMRKLLTAEERKEFDKSLTFAVE